MTRDRRNSTERSLDAKMFLFLAALASIPVLWLLHTYFGIGERALYWAKAMAFGFGVWLVFFFVVGGIGGLLVWLFSRKTDPTDEINKW